MDAALHFVIARIEKEAERSGAPLDEDEKEFLRHLPTKPTNPTLHTGRHFDADWPVLRDFSYERLCTLAKSAHAYDVRLRPEALRQWDFACAVLQLHHHPMSWLLDWASIRVKKARGLSDGCLLLITALLVITLSAIAVYLLWNLADRPGEIRRRAIWAAAFCLCGGILSSLYFVARRLERWQGMQTVERYRCDWSERSNRP